jgi:hypothetical protein
MPTTRIYSGTSSSNGQTTGGDIWPYWSSQIVTSSTAATTSMTASSVTWTQWSSNYQIQQTITTGVTGGTLSGVSTSSINISNGAWPSWLKQSEMQHATREQIVERERQYREQRVRQEGEWAIASRIREAANGRAERILKESLSPKQCEELAAKGYFELETIRPTGERKLYRINRGRSANVQEIDAASGKIVKRLCAHPTALVPDADTMLCQKLMLESQEDDFLRIANVS